MIHEMPAIDAIPSSAGHFLAGLIDAEAHLGMCEHNGGRSIHCLLAVAVRADDLLLLKWMKSLTGLGTIYSVATRGNPQVKWIVGRRSECAALAALLARFPLRSRKRTEFEIWRRAVEIWQQPTDRRDMDAMDQLRRQLIRQRAYLPGRTSEPSMPLERSDDLIDWLAGFVTGEAHLGIHGGDVRLVVNVRADELPLLRGLKSALGVGTVGGPYVNRGSKPSARWTVHRTSELVGLAEQLGHRLRGRKADEFPIWHRALLARADRTVVAPERRRLIDLAGRELKRRRAFKLAEPLPSANGVRVQRLYDVRQRSIVLLRQWAAAEQGPLTGEAYAEAREAGWPSRNALALRFGSWYDALGAAGLSDRAAVAPDVRDARVRAGATARAERRLVQRERVIAAIRRCAVALGRFPGPTEYARWRIHNDAGAPSFGTAYRVFPGGWQEIEAAYPGLSLTTPQGSSPRPSRRS